MKLASVLVAAAFVGLSGYTIYTHLGLGGDSGPVAEVVTLPAEAAGGARAGAGGASVGPETPTTSRDAHRRPEPGSERIRRPGRWPCRMIALRWRGPCSASCNGSAATTARSAATGRPRRAWP